MTLPSNISLIYYYSTEDDPLRKRFEVVLTQLRQNAYIAGWQSKNVSNGKTTSFTPLQEFSPPDIVVFLVSQTFVISPFCKSNEIKTIVAWHDLKKTALLPVILKITDLEGVPFKRMKSWPEDPKDAIDGKSWHNVDEALFYLQEHLKLLTKEIKIQKEEIEMAWQEALKTNDKKAYGKFWKKYKHTKYAASARKKMEAIEEKELWNEAKEKDTIESYLRYLKEAPLKNNKEEAFSKIHILEEGEDNIWSDANNSNKIALLLAYRKRFSEGKYVNQSNELLQKLVDDNLGFGDRVESLEIKSFGLHYYANENLPKLENFLYDYFAEYFRYMQQRIKMETDNTKNLGRAYLKKIGGWVLISIIIFFLNLLIKLILPKFAINIYPLLLITLLGIPVYNLLLSLIYSKYSKLFQNILTNYANDSVKLKVALALDKKFQLNLILKNFIDIENLILNKNYYRWGHWMGLILGEKQLKKIVRHFSKDEVFLEVYHPLWPLFKSESCDYLNRNIKLSINKKLYEGASPGFIA